MSEVAYPRVLSSLLWTREVFASVLVLLAAPLLYALWGAFESLWLRPRRIRRKFESQGIKCLPAKFLYGNLSEIVELSNAALKSPMPRITHDIVPRIMPFYCICFNEAGKSFVYWTGTQARLLLAHPQQAKEVLSTNFDQYQKPKGRPDSKDLIGDGLVGLEGEKWAQHRRIMNPAFYQEKLKAMVPRMAACTRSMVERWAAQIAQGNDEIEVHAEFKSLTADIIAHTGFGSSYAEGKRVFELQQEQQVMVQNSMLKVYIPGMRIIPTSSNRKRWRRNREINEILTKLIEARMQSAASESTGSHRYGTDLLGLMMASNQEEDDEPVAGASAAAGIEEKEMMVMKKQQQKKKKKDVGGSMKMGIPEIIGECKTFFFAGHETIATALTWASLMLAVHPEWQERAREEVAALLLPGGGPPTAEALSQMKIVGMVLNETMRLYPPVVMMTRSATRDIRLTLGGNGSIEIPLGTELMLPLLVWHHDPEYWGSDAHEFRPDRFDGDIGSSRAAFLPFSAGPRVCIGQRFAMMELKAVMAIILLMFRFRVSPSYQHAPRTIITLQPQFGMQLTFTCLHPL